MTLVLASASRSRAQILRGAGLDFEVVPAMIDEGAVKSRLVGLGEGFSNIALALAEQKAIQVSAARRGEIVLGADQILDFDGALLSKCASRDEAWDLMWKMRGRPHELVSAAALVRDGLVLWRLAERTRLVFRRFSEDFLRRYFDEEGDSLLATLGGYRLEGRGIQLFESIDGDYFSILGLPLLHVLEALRAQGEIAT